jgi:hypothetical protein
MEAVLSYEALAPGSTSSYLVGYTIARGEERVKGKVVGLVSDA